MSERIISLTDFIAALQHYDQLLEDAHGDALNTDGSVSHAVSREQTRAVRDAIGAVNDRLADICQQATLAVRLNIKDR